MNKYGLLGKSLSHSFSKSFFDDFFLKNKIDAEFVTVEIDEIEKVNEVFNQQFSGLTVTIPYKEAIMPYLDELSEEAKLIGAVNVVKFVGSKKVGYNSDVFGFHQSIKPFLTNKHERALILGSGGASKAVSFVLKSLGIDVIYGVRNPQKSDEYSLESINNHMLNACKVVVNCTPVGTFPKVNESIGIPFDFLTDDHLVIDLIYNPPKSLFLNKAEISGATILNGETMLREQALRAWDIWNESPSK